jgi:hypothetical protein
MVRRFTQEAHVSISGRFSTPALVLIVLTLCASSAAAQTVTVSRNVNLRPEQSTVEPPIRLLTPNEPSMQLLEPNVLDGYYHVKTTQGEEGYVWSKNVKVTTSAAPVGAVSTAPTTTINLGAGVPGSASIGGCGDGLWPHVYHPTRLTVMQDCLTVTGTIVDATAPLAHQRPDGVRKEPDGDTHGWLKLDPQFESLLNTGNKSDEGGNLVFELVCHFNVTQADAKPACVGFHDTTTIPPVGSHVAITGTFVTETNHGKWNEIHPVSSIKIQ